MDKEQKLFIEGLLAMGGHLGHPDAKALFEARARIAADAEAEVIRLKTIALKTLELAEARKRQAAASAALTAKPPEGAPDVKNK